MPYTSKHRCKKILPRNFEPTNYCVLCGHGAENYDSIGNRRFRLTVQMHKRLYATTETKSAKSAIVSHVISIIRSAGGEFIKKDGQQGSWYAVSEAVVREKVSSAFRDLLHIYYPSATRNKNAKRRARAKSENRNGKRKERDYVQEVQSPPAADDDANYKRDEQLLAAESLLDLVRASSEPKLQQQATVPQPAAAAKQQQRVAVPVTVLHFQNEQTLRHWMFQQSLKAAALLQQSEESSSMRRPMECASSSSSSESPAAAAALFHHAALKARSAIPGSLLRSGSGGRGVESLVLLSSSSGPLRT